MKYNLPFNNCIFVYDQINEDVPSNFHDFSPLYNIRGRKNNTIIKTLPSSTA